MIYDHPSTCAFDNLGWVDEGRLWCWDKPTGRERHVAVDGASYLEVVAHGEGRLLVTHHGDRPAASIRPCVDPAIELARIDFGERSVRFTGASDLWGAGLAILSNGDAGKTVWLIDGPQEAASPIDLSWFNADNYDLGYQGIVSASAWPDLGIAIIGIQRSSELVVIDLARNERVGTHALANRGGNPNLVRISPSTFLTRDYDVLCHVSVKGGLLRASEILQPPADGFTSQFVGDFDVDGAMVVVPRPYSGDVLRLDLAGLTIRDRAPVAGQPIGVCMTSTNGFMTRDWKSGRVATGEFSA